MKPSATSALKRYVKKRIYPVYFLVKPIYGFLGYFYRIYRVKKKLDVFDSKIPFAGVVGEAGWAELSLSNSSVRKLSNFYSVQSPVHLNEEFAEPFREIFEKIADPVASYFGQSVFLDGVYWMITTADNATTQLSANWHTDNVGNRLKVFVCFDGDGSQPTAIIPRGHKRRLSIFSREVLTESLRWARLSVKKKITGEVHLRHRTGSIIIFDTHNFHRGVYEQSVTIRKIFLLEFSQREKSRELEGPIGTRHYNTFSFCKAIFEIDEFQKFLDMKRVQQRSENLYCYVPLTKVENTPAAG